MFITSLLNKWPRLIVRVTLLVALLYIAFLLWPASATSRVYWLYVHSDAANIVDLTCTFAPIVAIFMLGIWAFKTLRNPRRASAITWLIASFSLCTSVYFSAMPFAIQAAGPTHVNEIYNESILYRLTFWRTGSPSGSDYYILFRCDLLGFLCEDLDSFLPNQVGEVTETLQIEMSSDGLEVLIRDGETIVYRYSLK
jgi:hypothetical protein